MDRQQAAKFMLDCLRMMMARKGSDLFVSADFPPACKIDGKLTPLSEKPLSAEQTGVLVRSIMNDYQLKEYDANKECNFAISPPGIGRFRVNAFVQQGRSGVVLRTIPTEIPEIDALGLPPVLKDLVLTKRGMILLVGGTGSGKSTSLAAMLGYRNEKTHGHIITIEDPVEFVHQHRNCLITQREVGVDTDSWDNALVNTLRQAPNVILIGEIRQRETMEHAINFSETGHLCLSTLHANNANQALDRIINLFPEERRSQLLMDLSLNLKAVISQRLLPRIGGGRVAAIEVMINSPLIQDLIFKGKVHEIKAIMKRSRELGMQTFDMALFDLYEAGLITLEDGLRNADSMNELRLKIKLESADATEGDAFGDTDGLRLVGEDEEDLPPGELGNKPAADDASESAFDLDSFDLAEASLDLESEFKQ
ncbi:PilT/PilU family type 4a pilus ATPase [Thiorhodovibrio frisius]|uniref:Pilus retraction protein PilT n=1 Tax=Thiorhodovibrio frisius TaxID=631362 RepID=H8YZV2_9GAMM|nr:PilT/PilU family type 4a pilus ATPase [Thiorhodovibrio frisius]EIC22229.1 pilus retraction protein PilT [Thiorhodovibrio frisius]WPL24523.1 Twitching mobility protein [Thiorhodovibrio frisius]